MFSQNVNSSVFSQDVQFFSVLPGYRTLQCCPIIILIQPQTTSTINLVLRAENLIHMLIWRPSLLHEISFRDVLYTMFYTLSSSLLPSLPRLIWWKVFQDWDWIGSGFGLDSEHASGCVVTQHAAIAIGHTPTTMCGATVNNYTTNPISLPYIYMYITF